MLPEGFVDVTGVMRSGVYLLLRKGVVVYVGQSVKLHARISGHVNGRRGKKMRFDQIAIRTCALGELDAVEKELIERYIPVYNEKSKPKYVVPLMDLIAGLPPAPMLPPNPEPKYASWRRL